jgi:hypothetical protein
MNEKCKMKNAKCKMEKWIDYQQSYVKHEG